MVLNATGCPKSASSQHGSEKEVLQRHQTADFEPISTECSPVFLHARDYSAAPATVPLHKDLIRQKHCVHCCDVSQQGLALFEGGRTATHC